MNSKARQLGVVLAVVCFAAGEARSQCRPPQFDFSSIRTLKSTVGNCRDAETFLHFVSSRGAWADAMSFVLFNSSNEAQVTGVCNFANPGIPGFVTDHCLKYTGECSPTISPVTACRGDSQTQGGEISCQCQTPAVYGPLSWHAAEQFDVQPWFMVDTDLDRIQENSFWGDSRITGKQQAVWMQWWDSAVTISWEDDWKTPNADFNDYVATFEMKECGPERFPPQALAVQDVACVDPCGDNACSEDLMSESTQRVRFTAGVTIDEAASEIPFEKNGRLIQLTLFGYDDFDKQLLAARDRTVAVCPVLNIGWGRSRLPAERQDWTTILRYGEPVCAPRSSDQSGAPVCSGAELSLTTLPISFSRQQSTAPNCNAVASSADLVGTKPSDACAANSFVRQYEISIDQIDASLTDVSLRLGAASSSVLRRRIESVDVYVFSDIQTAAFECPSGVNARLESVAPDIAKVVRYHLPLTSGSVATGRLAR